MSFRSKANAEANRVVNAWIAEGKVETFCPVSGQLIRFIDEVDDDDEDHKNNERAFGKASTDYSLVYFPDRETWVAFSSTAASNLLTYKDGQEAKLGKSKRSTRFTVCNGISSSHPTYFLPLD